MNTVNTQPSNINGLDPAALAEEVVAVTADPASSPARLRPSPPSATITMKASATPGSVAWATPSETSARLRRKRNVPDAPAAKPRSVAPSVTSVTL